MIGSTIKDFKLVERLGRGGWGEVWAAEQPIVGTRVAIKILRSEVSGDEAHVRRFFNEAKAVGGIPHAGIVKIFDVGWQHEQAFLIMELLDGEALTTRIRRETRLPLDEVIDIGRQIASVLAATHDAGVVHRDLKPDNVFLVPDAELGERVKILDFGIAKLSTVMVTGTGSLGTPAYMSPEQWNNPAGADHRADLYSLGCVLFEMCCGRTPFLATTPGEACTKHLTEQPPRARELAPALPIEIDDLIDGLLAKRPEMRPTLTDVDRVLTSAAIAVPRMIRPRMRSSLRDLAATAETMTLSSNGGHNAATVTSLAGAVIAQTQPPPPVPQRRRFVLGALLAGGAIAAAATFALTRTDGEHTPPPTGTPAYGLATLADYHDPKPATIGNQRSEQVWIGARDNFATACKQPAAPAQWCAGEQFAIGELALIRDDIHAAVKAFEAAVALDQTWSTAHLGLSNALAYARELEGALAAARKAQELEPLAWQPAAASARAYIAVGAVDDALIEYRRAYALSPKTNALLIAEIALAYHYAHKDDEASRYAEEATNLDRSLVSIELMRAERALEQGQAEPALTAAERALALSPKNGAALLARGDALALLGRTDEALATYKRASQLRGGKNILAISEPRLAVVESALASGDLPPSRTERAASAGLDQPAVDVRSPAAGNPGPPEPPRAARDVPPPRVPATAGNSTAQDARTIQRTRPSGDNRAPRSADDDDALAAPRTPPSTHERPRTPSSGTGDPAPRSSSSRDLETSRSAPGRETNVGRSRPTSSPTVGTSDRTAPGRDTNVKPERSPPNRADDGPPPRTKPPTVRTPTKKLPPRTPPANDTLQ